MSHTRKKIKSSSTKPSKKPSQNENSNDVLNRLDSLSGKTKEEHKKISYTSTSTRYQIIGVVIIIIVATAGLLALFNPNILGLSSGNNHIINTYDGFQQDTSATTLYSGGKLNILYVGGQFCPYCGMERWSIVMALEQFGTFSNLNQLPGGSAENHVPTYDFSNASYASSILDFTAFEIGNNTYPNPGPLQTMSSQASALYNSYDTTGSLPFICIGGSVYRAGAGSNLNLNSFTNVAFSTVQSQINKKSGPLYTQIHIEANYLIQLIQQFLATKSSTASTSVG